MFQRLFEEEREKLELTFRDALDATKEIWFSCSKCEKRNSVTVPDWQARKAYLEIGSQLAYGKTPTAAAPPAPVELSGDDLADKSPEELDELERQILASMAGSS